MDTDEHEAIARIGQEVHEIRQSQQQHAETLAQHEQSIRGLEAGHVRMLAKMDSLRSETALWTADLRTLVIERFDRLSDRLDKVVLRQGEGIGRDEAESKQRDLWMAALGIAVSAVIGVAGWVAHGVAGG